VSFAKLDKGILDSSLMDEDPMTRLVFILMLAAADRHGVVEMTPGRLAKRIGLDLSTVVAALERLTRPDEDSKSPDEDGRRLVPLGEGQRGWRIVNYVRYRDARDDEERRRYKTEWQRRKRATESTDVHGGQCGHLWTSVDLLEEREKRREGEEKTQEFGGDPPDLAPEVGPKKRRAKKDEELDWRVFRVHERLCARRHAVLVYLQGSAPGAPPALHPKLRNQIRTALVEFDADMLGTEDRERWERDSRVAAAGEGLWMNTYNNGSDQANTSGRRYVEPARAFTQFRKEGPHGVEQHSETFFRKRARDEARARANRRHDDGMV
jgi:hypothetical protein